MWPVWLACSTVGGVFGSVLVLWMRRSDERWLRKNDQREYWRPHN